MQIKLKSKFDKWLTAKTIAIDAHETCKYEIEIVLYHVGNI